jgi:glycosyltransferase involved in cell wall biosynthesis
MRILGVSPIRLLPADSGGQAAILGAYRQYARLTAGFRALAFAARRSRAPAPPAPFDLRETRTAASALIALERMGFTKIPYWQAQSCYGRRVAREAARAGADLVEITCPWLMSARRFLPARLKVVLVMLNVESLWYEDAVAASRLPRLFRRWLRAIERRGVERADLIVTLTERDRAALIDRYGVPPARVHALPPGFDPDAAPRAAPAAHARTQAVFAGSRFSGNRDAARALAGPVAGACRDFADILIAGTVCETLAGAALPANVRLLGFVDDLRSVLRQCDVFLNPSFMATGINTKVLDALACGLPVLSTPEGARGFEPLAGGAVRLAPLDGFAAALRAPPALSAADRQLVQSFAWPRVAQRRLDLYAALFAPGGKERP